MRDVKTMSQQMAVQATTRAWLAPLHPDASLYDTACARCLKPFCPAKWMAMLDSALQELLHRSCFSELNTSISHILSQQQVRGAPSVVMAVCSHTHGLDQLCD